MSKQKLLVPTPGSFQMSALRKDDFPNMNIKLMLVLLATLGRTLFKITS